MDSNNSPGDASPQEFRQAAIKLVDWLTQHFETLDECPVLPDVEPGDIRRNLEDSPPLEGESMLKLIDDIETLIMPGMTHWNHPRFFAYFSISSSAPGILGELLSAALNVNAMLWKTCPSATELEQQVMQWMRQMLGLPQEFWGILYDTASVSTLHALAAAREQLNLGIRENGMSNAPRLTLYTSKHAHSSVEKAAITLGIGSKQVRKIAVDDLFRMRPEALEQAIKLDIREGFKPFCVVATVGTTSTTSIDPVPDIANVCEKHGLWLHIDAAYGGSPAIIPEFRYVLDGCDRADSLVFNPHKWLFVPIDASAFYTRKPHILKQAFSLIPEYLRTNEDDQVENLMDYGIQLGRRFRALKLWFTIKYFGQKGLAERIKKSINMAQQLALQIDEHPLFERMAPTPFSTICFRAHPPGWDKKDQLNTFNMQLLDRINASRKLYLSHTSLQGNFVIRMAIGNIHTRSAHMHKAWQDIQDCLREEMTKIQES